MRFAQMDRGQTLFFADESEWYLSILKYLAKLGAGFEAPPAVNSTWCVSVCAADRIVFSGVLRPAKTRAPR